MLTVKMKMMFTAEVIVRWLCDHQVGAGNVIIVTHNHTNNTVPTQDAFTIFCLMVPLIIPLMPKAKVRTENTRFRNPDNEIIVSKACGTGCRRQVVTAIQAVTKAITKNNNVMLRFFIDQSIKAKG